MHSRHTKIYSSYFTSSSVILVYVYMQCTICTYLWFTLKYAKADVVLADSRIAHVSHWLLPHRTLMYRVDDIECAKDMCSVTVIFIPDFKFTIFYSSFNFVFLSDVSISSFQCPIFDFPFPIFTCQFLFYFQFSLFKFLFSFFDF